MIRKWGIEYNMMQWVNKEVNKEVNKKINKEAKKEVEGVLKK
jgi:hypothetical protein